MRHAKILVQEKILVADTYLRDLHAEKHICQSCKKFIEIDDHIRS